MRKINVLICDDQPEIVRETEELLLRYEEQYGRAMRILGVTDYEEAKDFAADLLFLDIEMPGRSGLAIRDELEKKSAESLIIFVTGHSEAVWEAFGRNVIGFFEKPMDYERLCLLMKKFFDLYSIYETVALDDCQIQTGRRYRLDPRAGYLQSGPSGIRGGLYGPPPSERMGSHASGRRLLAHS